FSLIEVLVSLSIFAVVMSHVFGILHVGVLSHISKFFNVRGVISALTKGPVAILIAIIEFAVGLLELVSEFAKVLSLSLRLFGNVFAGEILLTVMMGIFAYALPIPFIFLEILVGIIQATVFAMLTLAFFTVASQSHQEKHEEKTAPLQLVNLQTH
ncbi:MAG: F0F1 ATP synthase subunit A, partial [Patescibacteria group bacterium]